MMNGAHYDDADAQTDDEPTELADRHDGVAVERENIQATMEYTVEIEPETVADLPDRMNATELAENIAASRMNKELDPTFHISPSDAMASEVERPGLGKLEYREFTVFVRVSQND